MLKLSLRFVLAGALIFGGNLSYANDQPLNTLVDDFINNGVSHVVDKCSGKSWPLNCPQGKFLRPGKKNTFIDNNSGKKLSFQKFWYEGMNFSYRADDIVSLSIYSKKWPPYRGLGIGTSREKILDLFGKPIDHELDQSALTYCKTSIEDCVSFEFSSDGRASKITWSFYYD